MKEMNIREKTEIIEKKTLSEYAALSLNSKGRVSDKPLCNMRTIYQQDRDRIIHSKSFRRLKHKTQVFISAYIGDHYRTRLTHTLEVSQIARTIARSLRLNEDLTEAIALGHDLGHTPFGHSGESKLNELTTFSFEHNKQSLRIVDKLAKNGKGLDLSYEVKDGIVNHTGDIMPVTLEGQIVKIADRIAYINHDIDDGIRSGVLKEEELPNHEIKILGKSHPHRIETLVSDIVETSKGKRMIKQSKKVGQAMDSLRTFLFENFYTKSEIRPKLKKGKKIIELLFNYYMENFNELEIKLEDETKERKVADYISGMTDIYAINRFKEIYLP